MFTTLNYNLWVKPAALHPVQPQSEQAIPNEGVELLIKRALQQTSQAKAELSKKSASIENEQSGIYNTICKVGDFFKSVVNYLTDLCCFSNNDAKEQEHRELHGAIADMMLRGDGEFDEIDLT